MPQEKGKLPTGWQPFLFPAPFRTSETNQDTERGLYNVCTNNAYPDQVRKRKMLEMSMVMQVQAKKMKSNDASTKPLKRTPIPRAIAQLEDPWSLTSSSQNPNAIETPTDNDILCGKDGSGYSHCE
jgi:hypothetical protein